MKVRQVSPDYVKHLIAEEKQILLEHRRYRQMIITEAHRMKSDGYTPDEINEGLMDIIKSLGGGFIETFKYDIANWLLGKLGLNQEGFIARAISNIVEEIEISKFREYLSPGGCKLFADAIMDGLAETGIEPVVDGLAKGLGVDPQGRMYASLREALTKWILDGDLAEWIEGTISDWICNIDVSAIVDVFKGGLGSVKDAVTGDDAGGGLLDKVKGMFGVGGAAVDAAT